MSTSDQRDPADEQHTPRTADALAHSTATDVTSYLISGPVAFGLIGKGLDVWWGTGFLLPVGIVLGAASAVYTIIRRFGRVEDGATRPTPTEENVMTGEGAR